MIEVNVEKTLIGLQGRFLLKINFIMKKHEFLSIFGKSGSGKTTLLRMIAGLEKPDKGLIKVDDIIYFDSGKKINLPPQKRKVGVVFQNYALFPNMTVYENLVFAMEKEDKQKILEMLEKIELLELKDRYSSTLSGGQQQRVALARALIRDPKILLLDEPLSALDYEIRLKLQDEIKKIHRDYKLSTILISHDKPEVFKLADRVILLENGKVIKQGTPRDVFIEKEISGKFSFFGVVIDIKLSDLAKILTVDINGNLVEVVYTNKEDISIGDEVLISAKAFSPIVKKIKK
jgi:molybdate transport system ATP-binding protein